MVSVALLVWPLEELETGCELEVVAAACVVCAAVAVVVAVVPLAAESVCGRGEPANVTAPSASANEASVAAATRRWMRVLKVLRGVEGMQASCARGLSRGSAPPGRTLSVSLAPAR